jgi:tripartite-type tricarboxylate transporter receptor subunit TctC
MRGVMINRRELGSFLATAGAAAVCPSGPAAALGPAEFPNRTVQIVCFSAPGGAPDVFARYLSNGLQTRWNQTVIVLNKTGGSGVQAGIEIMKARPDGYTLLWGAKSASILTPQFHDPPHFDTRKDFTPISPTISFPVLWFVNASLPIKNYEQLIAYAKGNPGKLNFATGGVGSWAQLTVETVMKHTGIKMTHVPYRGTMPAIMGLLGNEIDMAVVDLGSPMPYINEGKLVAIAQVGEDSSLLLSGIPNLGASYSEIGTPFWQGILGPPAMPPELVKFLNAEIATVMNTPEMRERATRSYVRPYTTSPEEFAAIIERDWTTWGKIIRELGLTFN